MASEKSASRRRYSVELKAQVIAQCEAAGASVAKVAMSHGVNANVVHRWRQLARKGRALAPGNIREFVPVAMTTASEPALREDIRIEFRRGATEMTITWPAAAAGDCAAWMRELLR